LSASVPQSESPEAREQFRLCLSEVQEEAGVTACRKALGLGLTRQRAALVHDVLASKLASLNRWEESVLALRELTRLRPEYLEAQLRLGSALLHGLGQAAEAVEPLRHAGWLAPGDARVHAELALALSQLAEHALALAEFEEALRLDPSYLDRRPAARETRAASQRGERWP
jgi:tetratricopeptide (TPR) repeat protein